MVLLAQIPGGQAPTGSAAPIVRSIEVQYAGASTVSKEKILANMRTRVGRPYAEQAVEEDIRNLYKTGNIQNVRMVCNENGRCWRERGERRVIIRERDSYGYAPRERYIERRGYDEDRGGVRFRAPGVSVGIGTDRY